MISMTASKELPTFINTISFANMGLAHFKMGKAGLALFYLQKVRSST
jgi:hypothetical protein